MLGLLFFFGAVHSQLVCDNDWVEYNGICYKHFNEPFRRGNFTVLRSQCKELGAEMASGATQAEREFMERLNRPSLNGIYPNYQSYPEMLLVGTNYHPNGQYSTTTGEALDSKWLWCHSDFLGFHGVYEPNHYMDREFCHIQFSFNKPPYFCMCDIGCDLQYRRYICRRPKLPKVICRDPNAVAQNRKCVCRQPYIDIKQTNDPNKFAYQEGEKCVQPVVCRDPNAAAQNGKCVCKPPYIDIRQTDDPNVWWYPEGEKCVCRDSNQVAQNGNCICKPGFVDITTSNDPSRGYYRPGERCVQACIDPNSAFQNSRCVCKPGFIDIRDSNDPNAWRYKEGEKCIKPVVCTDPNAEIQNGRCLCKHGFVDIRNTEDLDRTKYKEGEKCVPEDPCRALRRSLSILFIVDASQSIQARNWPSLVEFLKAGANYIPSKTNVGFIKFSTDVSFANWLPESWSKTQFQQMVPTDFDAGYTNTPAAIERAIGMFSRDYSQDKIAVLITDGLPVINENTDKWEGLTNTENAILQLRQKGIKIVALGFGPELLQSQGDTYIKKWLEDPKEDYFSFNRMACDLRHVHMQILLQKVCRRYV